MALAATRTVIGEIELSCALGGITCYGEGRMLAHIEDFLRYDPSYIMRTWRSLDNGATWTELPYVHAHWNIWFWKSISPAPNVILVGVEGPDHCDEPDGGFTVGEHDIAAVSTDGGDTWGRAGDITALGYTVSGSAPWEAQCNDFWDTLDFLLLDDHEVWALGIYVRDGASLPDEYILRSTDDGLHFTAYVPRPTFSGLTPGEMEGGVYLGADTVILAVSMFNGRACVVRSTNRGATWTEILLPLNTTHLTNGSSSVNTIVDMGGGVLLAGGHDRQTTGSELHLWRSIDTGITWTIVSASGGLPQPGFGTVRVIKRIAPNVAVAFLDRGVNTIPSNFGGNLIWATTDNGVTWTAVPNDGYTDGYAFTGAGVGDDGSVSLIYFRDVAAAPIYVYRVVPTDIAGAAGPCAGFVLPEPPEPEPPTPEPEPEFPATVSARERLSLRIVGTYVP